MHAILSARLATISIGRRQLSSVRVLPPRPVLCRPQTMLTAVRSFSISVAPARDFQEREGNDGDRRFDNRPGGQFARRSRPPQSPTVKQLVSQAPTWLQVPDSMAPEVDNFTVAAETTEEITDAAATTDSEKPALSQFSQEVAAMSPTSAWFRFLDLTAEDRKQMTAYDYNYLLGAIKRAQTADTMPRMQQVFQSAKEVQKLDTSTYNMLLHVYVRNGDIDRAKALLQELRAQKLKPTTVTYNIMLYGLSRARLAREATALFEKLRSGEDDVSPDHYSFTTMIAFYCRAGDMATAENAATEMQTFGLPLTAEVEETMLRGYALTNRIKTALMVLNALKTRETREAKAKEAGELPEGQEPYKLSVGIYNVIIAAQWRATPDSSRLQMLYTGMCDHGILPNATTFRAMGMTPDAGFARLREDKREVTTQTLNGFLRDALKNNDFSGALSLVRAASEEPAIPLDVASYAMLIDAQVKAGDVAGAFEIFEDMRKDDVAADTVLYTTLIAACAKSGDTQRAFGLYEGMLKAGDTARPNIYTYNTLLGMLSVKGDAAGARKLLDSMTEHQVTPDTRSYNAVLTLYQNQANHDEIWSLYEQMKQQGVSADQITLQALMSSAIAQKNVEQANQIIEDAKTSSAVRGTRAVYILASELMQLYTAQNNAAQTIELWNKCREDRSVLPTQAAIRAVLGACQQQGLTDTADAIWADLELGESAFTALTRISYARVLLAAGRWEDMMKQFQAMLSLPGLESIEGIEDSLIKAGQTEHAEALMNIVRVLPQGDLSSKQEEGGERGGARSSFDGERRPRRFNNNNERDGGRFPPRRRYSDDGEHGERNSGYRQNDRPPRRNFEDRSNGYQGQERRPYRPREDSEGRPPRRNFEDRSGGYQAQERRPYRPREDSEGRPPRRSFEDGDNESQTQERRPYRRNFEDRSGGYQAQERRPYRPREDSEGRPPRRNFEDGDNESQTYERRPYRTREDSEGRPPRRNFEDRSGGYQAQERRPYRPREDSEGRPPRRNFEDRSNGYQSQERRPYRPREDSEGRPPRRNFEDRSGGYQSQDRRPFRRESEGDS